MKKTQKKLEVTETIPTTLDVKKDIPNPQAFPWPIKDGSISSLTCSYVLEFVPGKNRGKFMDEVYRILAPEGTALFTTRYWNTGGAVQDYRYEWPPLVEASFLYFNKGWRKTNNLQLDIECDFDFTYGYVVDSDTAGRSDDVRSFNIKNYSNTVQALQVQLVKRKKE